MYSLTRTFVNFQNNLYEVVRVFNESQIKNIELVKEFLDASLALRKNDKIYFCRLIEDAVILEENFGN
jgi:hypothetical protein